MNDYQLIVSELAVDDVNDIILWYKEQQSGIENRFLSDLRNRYNKILLHPELYGFYRITPQFHYLVLKHFPYYILYTIDGYVIRIIGIVHTSRSPQFIRRRYR